MASLEQYRAKRHFAETPEPAGRKMPAKSQRPAPIFVVQRHQARQLHFDFRLEINGVLASWAVPKGPPETTAQKRLAVQTEDHPMEYANFHGSIPKGHYGAGTVEVWDKGTYQVEGSETAAEQLEHGTLKFTLSGKRLNGPFVLVRTARGWLMIKRKASTPIVTVTRKRAA